MRDPSWLNCVMIWFILVRRVFTMSTTLKLLPILSICFSCFSFTEMTHSSVSLFTTFSGSIRLMNVQVWRMSLSHRAMVISQSIQPLLVASFQRCFAWIILVFVGLFIMISWVRWNCEFSLNRKMGVFMVDLAVTHCLISPCFGRTNLACMFLLPHFC